MFIERDVNEEIVTGMNNVVLMDRLTNSLILLIEEPLLTVVENAYNYMTNAHDIKASKSGSKKNTLQS